MVSRAQLNEYRSGKAEIERLLKNDIRQVWSAMDASDPEFMRDVLIDLLPGLVDQYGMVAAALAADFFADTVQRRPVVASPDTRDKVVGSTKALIGPLWAGNMAGPLNRVSDALTRHALGYGSATTLGSVGAHPNLRFARILGVGRTETGPCSWCRMLASRGAVYHSEALAGGLDDWHEVCACDAIAVRGPDDFPDVPGYEEMVEVLADGKPAIVPKKMWDDYQTVHESGDTQKDVTRKMREEFGYS